MYLGETEGAWEFGDRSPLQPCWKHYQHIGSLVIELHDSSEIFKGLRQQELCAHGLRLKVC